MIEKDYSLKSLNTFGIDAAAKYFSSFKTIEELKELTQTHYYTQNDKLVLGGGSNILFTQNFDGLVIKNELKGIELINEDENYYYVKAGAGENWHQFVLHCIANNYAGIENLSLIPGNVGASPMQNIGAYGVEIKDVFHELEAFHINEFYTKTFSLQECEFGYRESVFKNIYKNQFIITAVTYKLLKTPHYNTKYGAIEQELEQMGIKEMSIKHISDAVINIRSSKLPNPKELGNAGSFFKNPVVTNDLYETLKTKFPTIVAYPATAGHTKLAAGWLIENAGLKGYIADKCGVHKKQALVLVNYGGASGSDVLALSTYVIEKVKELFNVELEREVNIL